MAGAPHGGVRPVSGREGPRPAPREQLLQVDDLTVRLVRVRRRRHLELRVSEAGALEVRGPWRCPAAAAREAVRQHQGWLRQTLARAQAAAARRPILGHGTRLPLLDEVLTLELRPALRAAVCRVGERLVVSGPEGDEALRRAALTRWYHREAPARLVPRLLALGQALGVAPTRVVVRGQRTRWGSCSARGTVSLNWRLLLVPEALADYVLVHELCHLRHMAHSPQFWGMVAQALPDWRERRTRLRRLQASLPL